MHIRLRACIGVLVGAALAVTLSGCSAAASAAGGDVAATVNGHDIMEADVTAHITQMRTYYGCSDDSMWATLLQANSYTPESLRQSVIDSMVKEELIAETAADAGMTVSDDEVQSQIDQVRSQYGYTDDDTWQQALGNAGFQSEDDYFQTLKTSILQGQLYAAEVEKPTPTQDQIAEAAKGYSGQRASHILVADQSTADAIAARITAADDRDAQFAAELPATLDTGTGALASADGDLGWTSIENDRYLQSTPRCLMNLAAMAPGDVRVVQETDGYHVLYCTGSWTAPQDGSAVDTATIPLDLLEGITAAEKENLYGDSCSEYLDGLVSAADIWVADMPQGLAYDVDMTLANDPDQSTSTGADTGTADTQAGEDPTTTTTAASGGSMSADSGVTTSSDASGR